MSQEFVAKALNVSRQSVSKWENNKALPDIENIKLLSQLYQISIDEMLNNDLSFEEKSKTSENTINIENANMYFSVCLLSIILIASSFISLIGFIAAIIILLKTWNGKYPFCFYILCIACAILDIFNIGVFLNSLLFHIGIAVVQ